MFEGHSKTIVGLERLMLEASAFDFRSHNPQKLLLKVAKRHHVDPATVGRTAYNMSVDLYRTFTPLKQTTQTMALACVELAGRLHRQPIQELEAGQGYEKWNTTRAEVMGLPLPVQSPFLRPKLVKLLGRHGADASAETLLDLLDLYTHHRGATLVGQEHPLDDFIGIRITLNQEAAASAYPRHLPHGRRARGGADADADRDRTPAPPKAAGGGKATNGVASRAVNGGRKGEASPASPAEREGGEGKGRPGFRDGTVRFMLDGDKAREEKRVVEEFLRVEEEEYEVEVEVKSERNERRR